MNFTKAQRMLLGIAIGDAFGLSYEGKSRVEIEEKITTDEYRKGKCKYSDDTQMTIAVSELLLSDFEFNEETLASNFVYAYRRDVRRGYSSTTKRILSDSYSGKGFLDRSAKRKNRKTNGSAMRALPIGLLKEVKGVANKAIINSMVSHTHPEAIKASVGIALTSHYFYYDLGEPINLIKYVTSNSKNICGECNSYLEKIDKLTVLDFKVLFGTKSEKGLPCDALMTLGVVLYIVKNHYDNPLEALKQAVLIEGDVDSSASLVLGAVMINNTFEALPEFLLCDLENRKYGRDYLIQLGTRLSNKFRIDD